MKNTFIPSQTILHPGRKEKWYIVDAKNKCLGRVATKITNLLRGKNKITFTPSQNIGDYIIIINAEQVKVTGNKFTQKTYFRHSGRPGGQTIENFETLQSRLPERVFEKAIKGMLPKNRLGRKLFTKLKVYSGPNHPHSAQKPQFIEL
uniref:Large ribosomal subunit protein uL13c n=1 Tax=Dictyopteris divaricata TaxID=156996 RepID=A0A2I4Q2L0_9PHAE|nr:50S ribosomal protein L13 [Dictyopteris divaricata]YP_010205353.1 50S ribosomal protein L13 [Grateloupia livida]AQZ25064.1 50S ribosomal protein L13 [Dictyopteris divaricata]UAV85922.1 50S ribosomal protein L13 [Grateloupia livida]